MRRESQSTHLQTFAWIDMLGDAARTGIAGRTAEEAATELNEATVLGGTTGSGSAWTRWTLAPAIAYTRGLAAEAEAEGLGASRQHECFKLQRDAHRPRRNLATVHQRLQ